MYEYYGLIQEFTVGGNLTSKTYTFAATETITIGKTIGKRISLILRDKDPERLTAFDYFQDKD